MKTPPQGSTVVSTGTGVQDQYSQPLSGIRPMPSPGWHSDPGRPSTLGSLKNDLSNKPVQGNQSSPRQKISQSDALPSVDALPSPTTDSETVVPESASSDSEVLPPWVPTAAGAAAGGAAAVGAILTMAASGVRPREVWDGVKDLLTQRPTREETYGKPQPETSQPNDVQKESIMYQPPWEIGGPVLMDKSEYEDIQDKLSQGMTWTSGGWKTSEQLDQTERYRESIPEADRLRNEEIVRQQAEEKYIDKMVENSRNIVRKYEDDYSRQEFLQEFIDRHASGKGEHGEKMTPEKALQLHQALKNNLYEPRQLMNESNRVYAEEIDKELTKKRDYVAQVRDDAMRANRLLAKFDPTGVGSRIAKIQGMTYAGINGYEEGGVSGAVGSTTAAYLDGHTQGFATSNYRIIRDYAEGKPYLDKDGHVIPLKEALLSANKQHANDQWNVVEMASKVQEGISEGDLRKVYDYSMDAADAMGDFKGGVNKMRGISDRPPGYEEIPDVPPKTKSPKANSESDTPLPPPKKPAVGFEDKTPSRDSDGKVDKGPTGDGYTPLPPPKTSQKGADEIENLITKFKKDHKIEEEKGFIERTEKDLSGHFGGGSIEERNRGINFDYRKNEQIIALGRHVDQSNKQPIKGNHIIVRDSGVIQIRDDVTPKEAMEIKEAIEKETGRKLFFAPGSLYDQGEKP